MKIACEIDNIKTLKKGMKITLAVEDENVKEVMKSIYNFMDKPLLIDLGIDAPEQQERMSKISPEQRKKTYAILRDMAEATGQDTEGIKSEMKREFMGVTGYDTFSLSNCDKELAVVFIDFLIRYCFEYGIALKDNPKDAYGDDNIEKYIRTCLKMKKCCICGRPYGEEGKDHEPHHIDTVGMGGNHKKVDDSEYLVLPLCMGIGSHHEEIHSIGDRVFCKKYHVRPVKKGSVQ